MTAAHQPWPIVTLADAYDAGVERIGVKGWYLARLEYGGFEAPAGFVVEADAYLDAIELARVDHRLSTIWAAARDARDAEIPMLSRKARHLISEIEFSGDFRTAIAARLAELDAEHLRRWSSDELRVAVRSSATLGAVSGPEAAGVHTTYLGVAGVDQVLARIHSCWASLFGERALTMRAHGLGTDEPAMAVIVQTMVEADKSGIITPTGTTSEMLIEATFGLGEPIISGAVEPDRYVVDRLLHEARSVTIGRKQIVLPGRADSEGHEFTDPDRRSARVLTDAEIGELATLSTAIDRHFGGPHEVEWSIDAHGVVVLQVRPVMPAHHLQQPSLDDAVSGLGIGHGWATGRIRVVDRLEDAVELADREILVTSETSPQWQPHLQRAAAIVVDEGDATCHAARVAAEFGIPAIVGAEQATTVLQTGQYVTVDAGRGWVIPTVTFADSV